MPLILDNEDKIIVSDGHTVAKASDLIADVSDLVFDIYGTLIINGNLEVKNNVVFTVYSGGSVQITNFITKNGANINIEAGGTATITIDMILKNGATLNVDGLLIIENNLTVGNAAVLTGSGTVIVGGTCSDGNSNFCELIPLPVELLDFEASTSQNQVLLTWSTASEQDNDFFTLEKSKNGIDFVDIARVTGNGTTNLVSNYSFADNSPYLGLSYYKLSQTDYDGTTESFPAISIISMNQDISFSISPNPVTNSFANLKVSQKAKNELLELNIIDLQGKLLQKKFFKTDDFGNVETEFELKNQVQKGTYIFELVSAHNREYLKVIGN